MEKYLTKDGKPFTIRKPSPDSAEDIINYSKLLFASTDQVLTVPEEYSMTIDSEKKWIENINHNPNALLLISEMNSTMTGLLFFIPNIKKKISHTGEFGVSVHPNYQGQGIGRCLTEALIKWARDNRQIEKVILQVFSTNTTAINLYKKIGFIEEGRHVKAIKQLDGTYVDVLQMYMITN
jgi:RimJ/RimL family protein N-acetyltransferase